LIRWVSLTDIDVPTGRVRRVTVEGRVLALAREGDAWFAVDDACPHQGASLGEGLVIRGMIVCPRHNWAFDLETGACRGMPGTGVGCYPVRVCEGRVEIGLPGPGDEA